MSDYDIMPDGFDIRDLTDVEFIIFTRMRIGKFSATSKEDIIEYFSYSTQFRHLDWRDIRRLGIEPLRARGVRICNMGDGKGYYIAANEDEFQEFLAKYLSHAMTLLKTAQAMKNHGKVKQGDLQMELEGVI